MTVRDELRCTAMSKRTHERCGQAKSGGTEVCKWHGAKSPWARQSAKIRKVEADARMALEELHPNRAETAVRDPLEELARLAGEVVSFKDYLRAQVEKLDGVLTYWSERTFDDGSELHTTATEDVRATLAAYERALDRSTRVLAMMVKLDLAGRLVALREDQATILVGVIREGLSEVDMGMTLRLAAEAAIAGKLEGLSRQPVALGS